MHRNDTPVKAYSWPSRPACSCHPALLQQYLAHSSACIDACFAGGGKDKPSSFGRLCAACDPDMIAYAQLEVMAMLPSLKVAKLQQPPKVDEADIKVGCLCQQRGF